jgi:hypothetical protein
MDLNLRNVPEELMRVLKGEAGKRLEPVRVYCLRALMKAVGMEFQEQVFSVAGKSAEKGSARTGSRGHSKPRGSAGVPEVGMRPKLGSGVAQAEVEVQEPVSEKPQTPEPISGEKCWCGAAVHEWKNPTTLMLKWKCLGTPSHILTPKAREPAGRK